MSTDGRLLKPDSTPLPFSNYQLHPIDRHSAHHRTPRSLTHPPLLSSRTDTEFCTFSTFRFASYLSLTSLATDRSPLALLTLRGPSLPAYASFALCSYCFPCFGILWCTVSGLTISLLPVQFTLVFNVIYLITYTSARSNIILSHLIILSMAYSAEPCRLETANKYAHGGTNHQEPSKGHSNMNSLMQVLI